MSKLLSLTSAEQSLEITNVQTGISISVNGPADTILYRGVVEINEETGARSFAHAENLLTLGGWPIFTINYAVLEATI